MMDSQPVVSDGRAIVGAGQLQTPQEPTLDSFTQEQGKKDAHTPLLLQTQTPPVSPEYRAIDNFSESQDEPLFPEEDTRRSPQQASAPLFSSNDAPSTKFVRVPGTTVQLERSAIDEYVQARMAENERFAAMRREARLKLPQPCKTIAAAPREAFEIQQLRKVDRSGKITKTASPRKAAPAKPAVAKASSSRDVRPTTTPEPRTETRTETRTEAKIKARRSRTPKVRSGSESHDDLDGKSKHKRAAPSKTAPPKAEDVLWHEMPDFAPPANTAKGGALKAHWKNGGPIDNKDEPDFEHLAPEEVNMVSVLRMKPQSYLANKRRIFKSKLQMLKEGKNFTKTTAQGVTNIDVNKTSQMWEAFDGAGWFDEKWFAKWL